LALSFPKIGAGALLHEAQGWAASPPLGEPILPPSGRQKDAEFSLSPGQVNDSFMAPNGKTSKGCPVNLHPKDG
jgi:hypothetical protein